MSNSHCITSACATVNYRNYLVGKVRWRYGSQPWQEYIGGDNYSITPVHPTPAKYEWVYHMGLAVFAASAFTPSNVSLGCNNILNPVRRCVDETVISGGVDSRRYYSGFHAPIYKYRVSDYVESSERCVRNGSQALSIPCGLAKGYRRIEILCHGSSLLYSSTPVWLTAWEGNKGALATAYGSILQVPSGGEYSVYYEPGTNRYVGVIPSSYGWQYFYFSPLSSVLPTGYLFKVFKNGQEVYQQTSSTIPTVEVIPCSLSPDLKTFKVYKTPYLDRVDVVDKSINQIYLPLSNSPVIEVKPLPPECLNVYLTYILAPGLIAEFIPSFGYNPYQFITQICSSVGCPPPSYEVVCDDCCEKCPPGTCPIECGGQICCYNAAGISVQSIALNNYCGG